MQHKKSLGELLRDNDERDSDEEYGAFLEKEKNNRDKPKSRIKYNTKEKRLTLNNNQKENISENIRYTTPRNIETPNIDSITSSMKDTEVFDLHRKDKNRKKVNFGTNSIKTFSKVVMDDEILKTEIDSILLKDLTSNIAESNRNIDLLTSVFSHQENTINNSNSNVYSASPTQQKPSFSSSVFCAFLASIIIVILVVVVVFFLYKNANKDNIKRTSLFCGIGAFIIFLVTFSIILYVCLRCGN